MPPKKKVQGGTHEETLTRIAIVGSDKYVV
jgi:hypothetical protein